MKKLLKIVSAACILTLILQSCISDETGSDNDIITGEQKISSSLEEKIITTATSVNDFNLINFDCKNVEIDFVFASPDGNVVHGASQFSTNGTITTDNWETEYPRIKQIASEQAGFAFTKEDILIRYIEDNNPVNPPPGQFVNKEIFFKKDIITFFETCEVPTPFISPFSKTENMVKVSELNFNCSGKLNALIINKNRFVFLNDIHLKGGISEVEEVLASYNSTNNTLFTKDDIFVITILPPFSNNQNPGIFGRENMLNYLDNCKLDRDIVNNNDCLNFVYPITIDRFNIQTREVITTTITSDKDLIKEFETNVGELRIEYPISLLGGDGTTAIINSNEALLETLNSAHTYCGYE